MSMSFFKRAVKYWMPSRLVLQHARRGPVMLTFDDGPNPHTTPSVLERLQRLKIKATFFVVGQEAERHPGLLGEIYHAGHEIANHSFAHKHAADIHSQREQLEEIERTNQVIGAITGQKPRLYRPPYGELTFRVLRGCWRARLRVTLWSYDTVDCSTSPVPADVLSQALVPGDIVLMHDDERHCLTLLDHAIPALLQRGLTFGLLPPSA